MEEGGGVEIVRDGCADEGGFSGDDEEVGEIRELLSEQDAELEREDGEKDEEMAVANEVTGVEVGEDRETEGSRCRNGVVVFFFYIFFLFFVCNIN